MDDNAKAIALELAKELNEELRDGVVRVTVGLRGSDIVQRIRPGSGESFKDAPFTPEMVVVPAGEFLMGTDAQETELLIEEYGKDREHFFRWENPQHKVVIAKPFAVGRYTVTFDEWDAAAADGACSGYMPFDGGWGRDDRPVINVSWEDAQNYIKWLREKTGKDYRLPTEAEWEYAARAGTATPFWWGTSISPDQFNYNVNCVVGGSRKDEYRRQTVPVNSFLPNPWGLYQVHGNVMEWCEDVCHDDYNGAPADGSVWSTDGLVCFRVLRGGSWCQHPVFLRSAFRNGADYEDSSHDFGFRLVRTL